MKLSRLSLIIAVAFLAVVALTVSASAYTNEDLITYLSSPFNISGTQYKITDAQAIELKNYLQSNPVTDAQAAQIKALVDDAVSKANGYTDVSQIPADVKNTIKNDLTTAGAVAGVTVTINTVAKTVTVSTPTSGTIINGSYANNGNGGLTVNFSNPTGAATGSAAASTASNGGAKTFVYTGANGSVVAVIALLAVVAVSTVLVKKAYAK